MIIGPNESMPDPSFACGACGGRYYGDDAARACCQAPDEMSDETLDSLEICRYCHRPYERCVCPEAGGGGGND